MFLTRRWKIALLAWNNRTPQMLRLKSIRSIFVAILAMSACANEPSGLSKGDFSPPRITGIGLPRNRPHIPTDPIWIDFSEPIAAESLEEDAVVIVAHEIGGLCVDDFDCGDRERCLQQQCQRDPIDDAWLTDIAHLPLSATRKKETVTSNVALSENRQRMTVSLAQPLASWRWHTFVVSRTLTDDAKNALYVDSGVAVFRHEFVTEGEETSRPTMQLVSPARASKALPVNLGRIVVKTSRALVGVDNQSFWLEDAEGNVVTLDAGEPVPCCADCASNFCIELRPTTTLASLTEWTLQCDTAVADVDGRRLWFDAASFITSDSADHRVPVVVDASMQVADGCFILQLRTDEMTDLYLEADWRAETLTSWGKIDHEIVFPISVGTHSLTLWGADLSANQQPQMTETISVVSVPSVVISEVLLDPSGREPDQEFIELYNRGDKEVDLSGWVIDDNDDGVGSNLIEQGTIAPRQFAVIVGPHYNLMAQGEPPISGDALVIRTEKPLGERGLANRGELIILRDANGTLVSRFNPAVTDLSEGRSIERVPLDACGGASDWRVSPDSGPTPGRAPQADY